MGPGPGWGQAPLLGRKERAPPRRTPCHGRHEAAVALGGRFLGLAGRPARPRPCAPAPPQARGPLPPPAAGRAHDRPCDDRLVLHGHPHRRASAAGSAARGRPCGARRRAAGQGGAHAGAPGHARPPGDGAADGARRAGGLRRHARCRLRCGDPARRRPVPGIARTGARRRGRECDRRGHRPRARRRRGLVGLRHPCRYRRRPRPRADLARRLARGGRRGGRRGAARRPDGDRPGGGRRFRARGRSPRGGLARRAARGGARRDVAREHGLVPACGPAAAAGVRPRPRRRRLPLLPRQRLPVPPTGDLRSAERRGCSRTHGRRTHHCGHHGRTVDPGREGPRLGVRLPLRRPRPVDVRLRPGRRRRCPRAGRAAAPRHGPGAGGGRGASPPSPRATCTRSPAASGSSSTAGARC